jgi:hypothetical protein
MLKAAKWLLLTGGILLCFDAVLGALKVPNPIPGFPIPCPITLFVVGLGLVLFVAGSWKSKI